ncbi:MAG: hypothetical protein CFE45_05600 [Burkholderiales bacterium PBB5]|nr:MAG: hypothetical protein CFE45_05600 [Burkholderiales bacterium PBB5]
MGRWRAGASVAEALNAERPADCPVHFVPQADLPAGESYEAFIHRTAQVPTRNNLHDAFNGLVWLAQPPLKRRLNALQAAAIADQGVGATRGPLRDALTLFDENGALLDAPAPLTDALRRRDWAALCVTHRALWAQARLTLVGHALLEKLATAPRKGLTAHVLLADPLALDAAGWAAKPFAPLPVLGVPGWWPANAQPGFYDDAAVFRPPRMPLAQPVAQAGRKPSIDR